MSKASPLPRIIRTALIFFISMSVTFCSLRGSWAPFGWSLLYPLCGILVFIAFRVVFISAKAKQSWMEALSSLTFRTIHPSELPQLDRNELERLTHEWEALGFVQHGDFMGEVKNLRYGTHFSRLFQNESEGAVLELCQHFLSSQVLPFTSVIESFWGEQESEQLLRQARVLSQSQRTGHLPSPSLQHESSSAEELMLWLVATTNAAPGSYESLLRQPRVLVARLEANTSPVHLWHAHQKRCVSLSERLNARVLHSDLITLMRAHARATNSLTAQRLKAIPAWMLLRYHFVRPPSVPSYFDGELAPL